MDNFKKYPSLINVEHLDDVAWWLENYPDLKKEVYVVYEKVDGANLQILFLPDGNTRIGRRTDWLMDGEKFYDFKSAMTASIDLIDAFRNYAIAQSWPIRAYFELYGTGINRRVKYGNSGLALVLLDVSHVGEEFDTMWAHTQLQEFIDERELGSYLPPYLGSYLIDDAMGFNLNFDSKILGIENNQAEGIIIKPLNRVYFNGRGERFVLKAKHPDFGEVDRKPKDWKPPQATDEQKLFMTYLNDNRILSVFSKHGKIENIRQLGDYIKLVMNDAIDDFKREHPEIDTFDRAVFSVSGKVIVPLLRKYL